MRRLSRKEEGSPDSRPVISSTIRRDFEPESPLSPLPGFLLFPSFIRGRTSRWLFIVINQPISRPPLKPRVSSATRSTWTMATFSTALSRYLLVRRSESLISVGLPTFKSLPMQSLARIGRPTLSASAAGFLTSMGMSPARRSSSLLSSRLYQMVRLVRTPMSKRHSSFPLRQQRSTTRTGASPAVFSGGFPDNGAWEDSTVKARRLNWTIRRFPDRLLSLTCPRARFFLLHRSPSVFPTFTV